MVDANVLLSAIRERLSPFKCPKAVIHVSELLKTATGKIGGEKAKLRRTYATYYQ